MKFKIGDKVEIKEKRHFSRYILENFKNGGVVVIGGSEVVNIQSSKGITLWIYNNWLEPLLTKNQQLLFNFME